MGQPPYLSLTLAHRRYWMPKIETRPKVLVYVAGWEGDWPTEIGALETGAACVFGNGRPPAWRPVGGSAMKQLGDALAAARVLEGACDVEGNVDTSDVHSGTELSGVARGRPYFFSFGQMATGYHGADAQALERFFALLLELTSLREELEELLRAEP